MTDSCFLGFNRGGEEGADSALNFLVAHAGDAGDRLVREVDDGDEVQDLVDDLWGDGVVGKSLHCTGGLVV